MPPFRGMDEFDHAFRAAGVASGQWRLHDQAAGGRGLLVDVPADLVAASQGQCEELPYIEPRDLRRRRAGDDAGHGPRHDLGGQLRAGLLLGGRHRGRAVLRCRLALRHARHGRPPVRVVLALAAWCLTTWVKGAWAFVGLLVGLTPTLIYSTTSRRPTVWRWPPGSASGPRCSGSAAATRIDAALLRRERWLLAAATLAVVLLAGLRALGPLWVVLILACVARAARAARAARSRSPAGTAARSPLACVLAVATSVGGAALEPRQRRDRRRSQERRRRRQLGQVVRVAELDPRQHRRLPLPRPAGAARGVHCSCSWCCSPARRGGTRGAGRAGAAVVLAAALCLVVAVGAGRGHARGPRRHLAGPLQPAVHRRRRRCWPAWSSTARAGDRPARRRVRGCWPCSMLAVAQVISVVHVQLAELDRPVSAADAGWLHPPSR